MYQKELDFLKNFVKDAYNRFGDLDFHVNEKAPFDVVTEVDQSIERYFGEQVQLHFPGDTVHSEEYLNQTVLCDRTWILDPIDGTFNFATGSVHFGIQAAFWDREELRVSVIYLPKLGELYEAIRGGGAFCNGKAISVSDRNPEGAIFAFGDLPHARPDDVRDQKSIMENAIEKVAKIRMFGAACVDFTSLASGKTEGVVLFTKNKWDIAPGLLLAEEAGAKAYGLFHEAYSFESRAVFVCNKTEIYEELMKGVSIP